MSGLKDYTEVLGRIDESNGYGISLCGVLEQYHALPKSGAFVLRCYSDRSFDDRISALYYWNTRMIGNCDMTEDEVESEIERIRLILGEIRVSEQEIAF